MTTTNAADRDDRLVADGLLTRRETTLPQWLKRTLIDLRTELREVRNLRTADEATAAESAVWLCEGLRRRRVGSRWTDVRVAVDPSSDPNHDYVDVSLDRSGDYAGWVRVSTSRSMEVQPYASNVFYVRPLPYPERAARRSTGKATRR